VWETTTTSTTTTTGNNSFAMSSSKLDKTILKAEFSEAQNPLVNSKKY